MILDGQEFITTHWLQATIPGLAVVVTSLGLSLLGDGLSDLLKPGAPGDDVLEVARLLSVQTSRPRRSAASVARGGRLVRRRPRGQRLGIVGESGSGKSLTLRAHRRAAARAGGGHRRGDVRFDGRDLHGLSAKERRATSGARRSR